MSAAVSIYIYDHTPSGQSRLYKHRKSSVHGTTSYVVFQNIVITTVPGTVFVDLFSPSRLSSVQETPFLSAAWKTILKQVC